MKKILLVLFALAVSVALFACGETTYEIALITDKGDINDKSFNQGAWEGVVAFAEENNISHQYYRPEDISDDYYLAAIGDAVDAGAKVVVTPGFLFEPAIYSAQTLYPDVKFILLDGAPHTPDYSTFRTDANVASVMYAEEESGFLAGYAAVMDGLRSLGYEGGQAVPAVVAFGNGFLQGAEYAAQELGLTAGDVEVRYHYTGDFAESPENKATASAMFEAGAEVIFAAGGSVGKSVMAAASEADPVGKVIGVDVDQRYDSETVITSATKGLAASIQQILAAIYDVDTEAEWSDFGGKTTYFNASNDGVGLPTSVIGDDTADAFDRFDSFTLADYNAIFADLVDGTVGTLLRKVDVVDPEGEDGELIAAEFLTAAQLEEGLGLDLVTVIIVA